MGAVLAGGVEDPLRGVETVAGSVDRLLGMLLAAWALWPAEPLKTEISRAPVPIPASMALALSAHVAAHPGETLLGASPWAVERAVRAARRKVDGLPHGFRYHDLRHYFTSLLIASGAGVKTVQARLRHASAKTTLDCYGHLWPDRDEFTRAAVEAVFAARNPADSVRTTAAPR